MPGVMDQLFCGKCLSVRPPKCGVIYDESQSRFCAVMVVRKFGQALRIFPQPSLQRSAYLCATSVFSVSLWLTSSQQ